MEPSRSLETPTPQAVEPSPAAPALGALPPVEVTDARVGIWRNVREAWAARSLVPQMWARGIAKFAYGAKLGRFWLVMRALMDSLGNALLFGGVLRVATPGDAPYYLFLLSGLVGWRLFERSMRYVSRSFTQWSRQMKSFRFPLLLVPLAGMALPIVEIAVYWLVFIGALAFFWLIDGTLYLQAPPELLLVLPGLALLLAITVGFGLWVSVLNAKARDTRHSLRYILPFWLYMTPVLYPLSQLPEGIRWVAIVNPLTAPVELMRSGLIGAGGVNLTAVGFSIGFAVVVVASGLWFFNREAARSIDAYAGADDDDEEEEGMVR